MYINYSDRNVATELFTSMMSYLKRELYTIYIHSIFLHERYGEPLFF